MNTPKKLLSVKLKILFVIPLLSIALLLFSFGDAKNLQSKDDKFVVVLDAGHGGHDPGNLGNGYLEKNIALNIVLKIGSILEKNPDIKVIYTRRDDTFVDLFVRGEIANKADADLFVSVHCDSHTSDAHGAGTFVLGLHANKQNFEIAKKENSVIYLEDNYESRYADYDINSPESIIGLTIMQEEFLDQSIVLAKAIQDNFSGKLNRVDRKVKQAGFIVLHQTFMPSVLVETGFLTNKEEGKYLNSGKGQSEMGTAIAEAILKYKSSVQSNTAIDIVNVDNTQIETPKETKTVIEKPKAAIPIEPKPKESEASLPNQQTVTEKTVEKPIGDMTEEPKKSETADEQHLKEIASREKKSSETEVVKIKPDTNTNIIFKVQLLASAKEIALVPENFKGLGRLSKEPFDQLFRYMYGNTNSYREAEMLKSNADLKGYPSSYIVAYKNGERIPLPEALKYVSE